MIQTKKIVKQIQQPITAQCDNCDAAFDQDMVLCEGWGQVKISFGYGSNHDGEIWQGEICDVCFDDLIKQLHLRRTHAEFGDFNEQIEIKPKGKT